MDSLIGQFGVVGILLVVLFYAIRNYQTLNKSTAEREKLQEKRNLELDNRDARNADLFSKMIEITARTAQEFGKISDSFIGALDERREYDVKTLATLTALQASLNDPKASKERHAQVIEAIQANSTALSTRIENNVVNRLEEVLEDVLASLETLHNRFDSWNSTAINRKDVTDIMKQLTSVQAGLSSVEQLVETHRADLLAAIKETTASPVPPVVFKTFTAQVLSDPAGIKPVDPAIPKKEEGNNHDQHLKPGA